MHKRKLLIITVYLYATNYLFAFIELSFSVSVMIVAHDVFPWYFCSFLLYIDPVEAKEKKVPKKSERSGNNGNSGSAVIELTEVNFNALVVESNDHWLVEFYAPW